MGIYEAELKRIVGRAETIVGNLGDAMRAVPDATFELDCHATLFKGVAAFPGIEGTAADMASDHLEREGTRAASNSDAAGKLGKALERASASVLAAKYAYRDLPDATISMEQQIAIVAGAGLVLPIVGFLGGKVALDQYQEHLNQVREEAAEAALDALYEETSISTRTMLSESDIIEMPPPPDDIPIPPPPPPPPLSGWRPRPAGVGGGSGMSGGDSVVDSPGQPGGAAAGVVGLGAAAGLAAGLGKLGSGGGFSGPAPGLGGAGGSRGGASGVGSGSRVSADSANGLSRSSSRSGGLNGGLGSARSGGGGFGSGATGLARGLAGGSGSGLAGAAGSGVMGGPSSGAGSGASGGAGSGAGLRGGGLGTGGSSGTGVAGGAGGRGMMMGGMGGGAGGGDKDKARTSLGYRAPKIEAGPPVRQRRGTVGDAGSRADFPERDETTT